MIKSTSDKAWVSTSSTANTLLTFSSRMTCAGRDCKTDCGARLACGVDCFIESFMGLALAASFGDRGLFCHDNPGGGVIAIGVPVDARSISSEFLWKCRCVCDGARSNDVRNWDAGVPL